MWFITSNTPEYSMKKLICDIPEETHWQLKEIAKRIGTTKASLVKIAIDDYMRSQHNE